MNPTTIVAPEVRDFLTAVRAQLADLDPEEQRDILDGLEADLTDLVAERGGEALGDPVAYARELRTAAGLSPEITSGQGGVPAGVRVHAMLDAGHGVWVRTSAALPGDLGGFATTLRPLWWIVRAWVAVELVDQFFGRGTHAGDLTLVPHLRGLGWALLLVAAVVSVQVGRSKLWPGRTDRGALARVILLGLNVAAIAVLPLLVQQVDDHSSARYGRGFELGYQQGARDMRASGYHTDKAGLYADGKWVSNIYPYDAQGRPLVGVQLFNQIGKPINVMTQPEYVDDMDNSNDGRPRVSYPWTNGAAQLLNVFPIPTRVQDGEDPSPTAFAEADPPAIGAFPLASVPPVSLPGIEPSKQRRADR